MNKFKYDLLGSFYRNPVRPVFFSIDPERIHDLMIRAGHELGRYHTTRGLVNRVLRYDSPRLKQKVAGIDFSNPIGLSAGFDKNADLVQLLPELGFGFMEAGSITLHPYEGNQKPRLFRLPKSKGIVVYYGLKNIGVDRIIDKLEGYNIPRNFPLGISIAKTNSRETATDEEAVKDYVETYRKCLKSGKGDFYTINISCPNTFGGEPFTTPKRLEMLLSRWKRVKSDKPIFIKMPINLSWAQFDKLLEVIVRNKIDGVVIGNLNKDRKDPAILESIPKGIQGGISGLPTRKLSNRLIQKTYQKYGDRLVIIGVGGVFSAEDAYEKIRLGASLIQLVTGIIYEGPQLIGQINCELDYLLERDGYSNVSKAIGVDNKRSRSF